MFIKFKIKTVGLSNFVEGLVESLVTISQKLNNYFHKLIFYKLLSVMLKRI